MTDWAQLVRELGFPVAITIYLLVRFDRLLGDLRDAVRDLVTELRAARKGP